MRVLYLEPFEGGSHAAFTRSLTTGLSAHEWTVLSLPARHWKWRMRGAAAHFALDHGEALARPHDLIFASAYLPLAELRGLVPSLAEVPAVLYFHENQLAYPVRAEHAGPRDHHFGFTQLVSALAAQRCVFNSAHNRDSFLEAGAELLARMPDAVPSGWIERIRQRSEVLPLPLELPAIDVHPDLPASERAAGPLLVWNHRWEYDKDPATLFRVLEGLAAEGVPFRLAVCGQRFRKAPECFARAEVVLADRIESWGPLPPDEYWALLGRAQVVLSTAIHEFFGIAVLEGVHAGACPLVPDRLAYPELIPAEYRWGDEPSFAERLRTWCRGWTSGALDLRASRSSVIDPVRAARVLPRYGALFDAVA